MPFRNTGEQEVEQYDTNPKSPSFGQKRWITSGVNTTACPINPPAQTTFRSAEIRETVYRDDCPNGQFPNGVVYVIAEGYNVSLISQQDADRVARNVFDVNKQAFANQNDTCSAPSGGGGNSFECVMSTEGCWTGLIIRPGEVAGTFYTTQAEYNQCYVLYGNQGPRFVCPAV